MKFPGKQCGSRSASFKKLADQDPTVYHAAYVILHGLVDTIMCFHILIIASGGDFYLLFGKNY